ncbi:MAG TPA: enolase C-terminal domain-like protein [Planctomycetota bacterium]|nr:enolase C-terminal domain-like protein [Planctomycetota bacterium]
MNRRTFVSSLLAGGAALVAAEAEKEKPVAGADDAAKALSEHRIAKIEARRLQDRFPRFVGRNSKGNPTGTGAGFQVRTLITDKGARGWGMSWVPDDQVQKFVGARVSDLFDVAQGTCEDARSVLDFVLHDLAGNILGKPVAALLGGKGPKEVPIYSGAIYFDDLEPKDKPRGVAGVVASCQQDYDAGYRAFKLKIGRGFKWIPGKPGIQRDIEVTRAVREKLPDCKVLVDANDGYTPDDFLGYLSAVADCNLYWIEEPFQERRDDLVKLREHMAKVGCKALIAEGEGRTERADKPWKYGGYTQRHIETLYALAKEKLVDVFLLDLGIIGFSRWRTVMPELVQAGVQASPHTWVWSPRPYYTAHVAAGLGNVVIVEGIPAHAKGIDYSAYKFAADGKLVVPDAPGFGLGLTA